jgi:formate-dependent nitrite reductase membrane component NrfD
MRRAMQQTKALAQPAASDHRWRARSEGAARPATYYNQPMIKKPTWRWFIPLYFVLGGIAGGVAFIGALADFLGGSTHRSTVRHARYLSLALALICPLLLIADLGRPARFVHMFRVFKFSSPLSVGTWILTGFGLTSGALAARQAIEDDVVLRRQSWPGGPARLVPEAPLTALHGLLGLGLGGYTGVLLAATAVPLWAAGGLLLGPLFLAASVTSGAAALVLAELLTRRAGLRSPVARREIEVVATVGTVAQLALAAAREAIVPERINAPLRRGVWGRLYQFGTLGIGLIAPLGLRLAARLGSRPAERLFSAGAAIGTLIGAVIERFALLEAGKRSATDPLACQELTRGAPGQARPTQQQLKGAPAAARVQPFQSNQVMPPS